MDFIIGILSMVSGVPLMVALFGTGILLSLRLLFLQVRYLPLALRYMVKNEEGGVGEVTSLGALCTALSATIGTGNIVGVAGAIVVGGPGALFWMWVAAFFGMATKYAEGVLAIKYRTVDKDGHALGGPFYYIEKGMGANWKWLGKAFALFAIFAGLLSTGTMTQINGIATAAETFFDPNKEHLVSLFGGEYTFTVVAVACLVTLFVTMVLIGGVKRIATVSTIVVPFMAILYVAAAMVVLISNASAIPAAFATIVSSAFGVNAMAGGAFGAMMIAMQQGVARGIFSNEAGLGSAPIAAAAAQTKEPVRQGLVSMTGTFIDTIIVCSMTGLSIVVTGAHEAGLEGSAVTAYAFSQGAPWSDAVGSFIIMITLVFFAFTTILGWNYYTERCLEYLVGGAKTPVLIFRWIYIAAVFIGPFVSISTVWAIADSFNSMMAFPNLIALVALSGVVVKETKDYFERLEYKKSAR